MATIQNRGEFDDEVPPERHEDLLGAAREMLQKLTEISAPTKVALQVEKMISIIMNDLLHEPFARLDPEFVVDETTPDKTKAHNKSMGRLLADRVDACPKLKTEQAADTFHDFIKLLSEKSRAVLEVNPVREAVRGVTASTNPPPPASFRSA